eukprot:CAMPEP_0176343508 /NCGR_PEP_ID=MMETSP0126-20121128/3996_1 /TAXON_ID=141414 ORGANISM="Strombidinopsis acuminatum, Strain SPMC142" /NCGR_SAMPLE_ID=MMETSP0126 /ASSEMBLY_ACC=CAM_ASM_000229 /LENGTH=151 /DNA_ID=CAMNT_0017689491 /DNA_START=1088 /DNA_END=1543 /DNA_ORIENTATION=+
MDELAASILYHVPQKISLMEWFFKGFFEFCCVLKCCKERCCKKYHLTFDIHNEALSRLSRELDLLDFLEASRVTRFMSSIYLRYSQRLLIPYFRKYFLDSENLHLPDRKNHRLADLIVNFDATANKIDQRILYEITKRKSPDVVYSDEEEY